MELFLGILLVILALKVMKKVGKLVVSLLLLGAAILVIEGISGINIITLISSYL